MSAAVREAWEFYRDNCTGFKEPMRRKLRELDEYVSRLEARLGHGTCRVESMHGYTDPFVSTRYSVELSCHTLEDWPDSEPPDYCPWRGAKVVE